MSAFGFGENEIRRIIRSVRYTEGDSFGGGDGQGGANGVRIITFKVTSNASGGGKYFGKLVTGISSAVATGNLAESDIGTVASTETVLALNVREVGKSTHDIASSGYLPLIFTGKQIGKASDGKLIVIFDGYQWKDC